MSQYERTNKKTCAKHLARLQKCMDSPKKPPSDSIRSAYRYYSKLLAAWPEWASNDPRVKAVYRRAQETGKTVDHIVPLSSSVVCGLHVYANLQLLSLADNLAKSNNWWPDSPYENHVLFSGELEPHQMALFGTLGLLDT